ncbi:preprotein translocase subunit SecE [bacterium]|nr:preprotein translocase subunit SecE [bacterium]
MAKNNTKLDLPEIEAAPAANSDAPKAKKTAAKKSTAKKRKSVGKFFRDVISELKKVEWASFKNTKSSSGVLKQTSTVLVVVLFFLVVIAGIDAGFTQLLKLLLEAAA